MGTGPSEKGSGKTGMVSHYCDVRMRGDICDDPKTTVNKGLCRTVFTLLVKAPGLPPEFFKVVHFCKDPEIPARLLVKGDTVEVEGRIHLFTFTDTTGTRRIDTQILPDRIFNLDQWFEHKHGKKGSAEA